MKDYSCHKCGTQSTLEAWSLICPKCKSLIKYDSIGEFILRMHTFGGEPLQETIQEVKNSYSPIEIRQWLYSPYSKDFSLAVGGPELRSALKELTDEYKSLSIRQFVGMYCTNGKLSYDEFYRDYVVLPDNTSPNGWDAVCNNPRSIQTHINLYC